MKIDYKIMVNGIDKTKNFKLVSMIIKDEMGEKSDSLEITVDDEEYVTEIPASKVSIVPYIGLENGLISCGEYTLDHVETTGFPAMMTLFATAVPLNTTMNTRKEKTWINFTIAEIVTEIAQQYDFPAALDAEIGAIKIPHINQTSSDIHFLRRLASEYGAIFKFHTKHLIFVKKGNSALGLLKEVKIHGGIKRDWRHVAAPLSKYSGVAASYHDGNKELQTILVGDEGKVYKLKTIKKDKGEAERLAKARFEAFRSGNETLSISLDIGKKFSPLELTAGQSIELTNLRKGVNGKWLVKNIEHTLSRGRLESKIECERGFKR
ncbi:MAG: phage late control D family protein [Oligoflexales bacterium]